MAKHSQIGVRLCFLLLLPSIAIASEKSTSPYQFYFTNGDYYVSHDDVMTGCVRVPHTANGARKSAINKGGQCAILYARGDCHGPKLAAPSGYTWSFILDEVSSFHLCSWEPPQRPRTTSPPNHKASEITLYDDAVFFSPLAHFKDLQQCTNLPSAAVKNVGSVNTHGNCVRLFEDKNCRGSMHEMTPTSLYHWDLGRLGFNNRATSISPCQDTFVTEFDAEPPVTQELRSPFRLRIARRRRDADELIMPLAQNNETHF